MRPSRQSDASGFGRGSIESEERLPVAPLKYEIKSVSHRLNPATGREETYYTVYFVDFDDAEKEVAEKELLDVPEGVKAIKRYLGVKPSGDVPRPSASLSSRRTLQTSQLEAAQRASVLRNQEVPRMTETPSRSTPQINTQMEDYLATPEPEETYLQGPLDALEWAAKHYSIVPEIPEWQISLSDLAHTPSTRSEVHSMGAELPMMSEERLMSVPGPSPSTPQGEVLKIELTGRVLVRWHDGTVAWLPIHKDTPAAFVSSP